MPDLLGKTRLSGFAGGARFLMRLKKPRDPVDFWGLGARDLKKCREIEPVVFGQRFTIAYNRERYSAVDKVRRFQDP
jgi:hypothetical protein